MNSTEEATRRGLRHTSGLKIPTQSLSEPALARIVEEFVLREGTDYGGEYSLEQKCAEVRKALDEGSAEIHFDPSD